LCTKRVPEGRSGQFRIYQKDQQGNEVTKSKKVVLGPISQLRKHDAKARLREIIQLHNRGASKQTSLLTPDGTVTFGWFVKEKYFPFCRGRWSVTTKKKMEYEINRYLVGTLKDIPLTSISLFELQTLHNKLAEKFSESIVRHAFVNLRSIMKVALKLKVLAENPGEDLEMPITRTAEKARR